MCKITFIKLLFYLIKDGEVLQVFQTLFFMFHIFCHSHARIFSISQMNTYNEYNIRKVKVKILP